MRNGIVIIIVGLFIGISIAPNISGDIGNKNILLESFNNPPDCRIIKIDPQSTIIGLSINFSGKAWDIDNETLTISWDFGDGIYNSKTDSGWPLWFNTTHVYESPGTYKIYLNVTDDIDKKSEYDFVLIYNSTPDPPYKPEGNNEGYTASEYEFETSAVDPSPEKKISYQWDWGKGNIDDWTEKYYSGCVIWVSHSWDEPGLYEIKVRCKNNYGISDWSESHFINITIQNFAPSSPGISGPLKGKPRTQHTYKFTSHDYEKEDISYLIDWGDGTEMKWIGPFPEGEAANINHSWNFRGDYTIRAKARDASGHESDWATYEVTMPKNKATNAQLFLQKLFQRFPLLNKILNQIIL